MTRRKERNSLIDLYRFLAMLGVMGCHQYHMGLSWYPFSNAWIFADFFFMLTGYLTAGHFRQTQLVSLENAGRNAIGYTWKKFREIVPFAWTAMMMEYAYQAVKIWMLPDQGIKEVIHFLSDLPLEMLMLTGGYRLNVLVPSWYLSALFLVFPLFCILVQTLSRSVMSVVSLFVPVFLYALTVMDGNCLFPDNFIRSFSDLLLGVLAYELGSSMIPKVREKIGRIWLTLIQLICLVLPLVISYTDPMWALRPIMLCFVIGIAITMSQESCTRVIRSRVFLYLGQITMPLYLFHWTVAGILSEPSLHLSNDEKYWLFYGISIAVAAVAYELYRLIKRKKCR
ncbi:MAG: acyltransferase [Clostridia bacterium]|nr:acyltransferase [Clostridia bacterium]